jgi:hypothetical protein
VDLNLLLHRHQLSLMLADRALSPRERRAQHQFAREFAEQIQAVRRALGAGRPATGSVT